MTDVRYWLLDAAVEHGVHLSTLADPKAGEILNRKPIGLPPVQVADILARMIDDGEITLGGDFTIGSGSLGSTATQILHLMSDPRLCWYKLTERGGAEWEAWAKPQWSRYVKSCERDNLSAIWAARASFAEELLGMEEYLNHQRAVINRSIRHRTFRSWRATYWKTLPEGHLIAFRTRPLPKGEWGPMPHREWARWVDLRRFYLRPADCGF